MSSRMQMCFPIPKGRRFQNEDQVTFKRSKELKLRDSIAGESRMKNNPCLYELSLVFTCLKESKFNEKECLEEVKKYNNCCIKEMKETENMKLRRMNPGKVLSSGAPMIPAEINQMFLRYKK